MILTDISHSNIKMGKKKFCFEPCIVCRLTIRAICTTVDICTLLGRVFNFKLARFANKQHNAWLYKTSQPKVTRAAPVVSCWLKFFCSGYVDECVRRWRHD